jgi:hypothetical protein
MPNNGASAERRRAVTFCAICGRRQPEDPSGRADGVCRTCAQTRPRREPVG